MDTVSRRIYIESPAKITSSVIVSLVAVSVLFVVPTNCRNCSLPDLWEGKWFINEFRSSFPIIINSTTSTIFRHGTNDLGECIWGDGSDQFVFFNEGENCIKCVLVIEKHKNVLQTRESECHRREDWDQENPRAPCQTLLESGDYFSWFKFDYKPIDCPFKDTYFSFTYEKSGFRCETPISRASSCFEGSKMELQYKACPDVSGSEAIVEQLMCVGDWNESGFRYLVTDTKSVDNLSPKSIDDRFHCFVLKEIAERNVNPLKPDVVVGYDVGTLKASTCAGLHSPYDAETTLYLRQDSISASTSKPCELPAWLTTHVWTDMSTTLEFVVHPQLKNRTISIVPGKVSHVAQQSEKAPRKAQFIFRPHSSLVCSNILNITEGNDNHVGIIGKYYTECKIDERCIHLVKRSEYIFQVYYLKRGSMSKEDFTRKCFGAAISDLQKIMTMVSTRGIKKACPKPGVYDTEEGKEWLVGCQDSEKIDGIAGWDGISLQDNSLKRFDCTDEWKDENGATHAVIAETKKSENTTGELLQRGMGSIPCRGKYFLELYCLTANPNSAETLIMTTKDCIHFNDDEHQAVFSSEQDQDSEAAIHLDIEGPPSSNAEDSRSIKLTYKGSCTSMRVPHVPDSKETVPDTSHSETDSKHGLPNKDHEFLSSGSAPFSRAYFFVITISFTFYAVFLF